jgi:hypothetical protein
MSLLLTVTVAANVAATGAQNLKIEAALAVVMKDCNSHLTHALCQALNTIQKDVYQYLTNLDFVTDASGCRTNFGRIPQADVRFPHVQLFSKLLMEYFKVGRLLGSSNDNNFALFMSPDISEGIETYKKRVAPWFVTVKNLNFTTDEDFQDCVSLASTLALASPLCKRLVKHRTY